MAFWHNTKYEDIEKSTINGDLIRGIPAKNFPWLLKNIACSDSNNDTWQIKVFCTSIEGNEFSQKLKAKISLEATCHISEENLEKMGLEYQRLFALDFKNWNLLFENYSLEIFCLLDKIEEKTSHFYKVFFKKIQDKYHLNKKRECVTANIKNCKISNFS